jgi:hypothetical protein
MPFEMGAFIVFEVTERALELEARRATTGGLSVLEADDVWLNDQGAILVEASQPTQSEAEVCRALVGLLGALLVRSATGVPGPLLELAEQGPSDGNWSLSRLHDDLEASLIPLNRAAMRRAIGRLLREVRRETDRSSGAPSPDARAVDRDFDKMLGLPPGEAAPDDVAEDVDLDDQDARPPIASPADRSGSRREAPSRRSPSLQPIERTADTTRTPAATPMESEPRQARASLDEFEQVDTSGGGPGIWLGVGLTVAAAALVAAYFFLHRTG